MRQGDLAYLDSHFAFDLSPLNGPKPKADAVDMGFEAQLDVLSGMSPAVRLTTNGPPRSTVTFFSTHGTSGFAF
jgi:hypothetical protein